MSLKSAWVGALSVVSFMAHGGQHATNRGYSGLINIPNAYTVDDGMAVASLGNDVAFLSSENYSGGYAGFSLGLHERVEIGGLLAEYRLNPGATGPRARDLSGHIKVRLFDYRQCSIAGGISDFAGEAIFFKARYLVSSCQFGNEFPISLTAGYAVADESARVPLLDGAFAGIEWQPSEYFSLIAENDTRGNNLGIKANTSDVFSWGNVYLLSNVASTLDGYDGAISVGVNVALGRQNWDVGNANRSNRGMVRSEPQADAVLSYLVDELASAGLEKIRIAVDSVEDRVWIEYQNESYHASQADALGVALGIAAKRLAGRYTSLSIVTRVASQPVIVSSVEIDAYRQYVDSEVSESDLTVEFASRRTVPDLAWRVQSANATRVFLELSPDVVNFAGNEAGAYSQSTALRVSLMADLGAGFRADSAFLMPLHHSSNFDDGEPFAGSRQKSGLQQLSLQYHSRWGKNVSNLTTFGLRRINGDDVRVGFNETIITDNSGLNALRINLAEFDGDTVDSSVKTLAYTRYLLGLKSSVSVKYGDFFFGDRGGEFRVNRYIGDTIVGLFIRYIDDVTQSGGLSISLPLTARRGMKSGPFMVRGTNRWGYAMTTTVNDRNSQNPINQTIAVEPVTRNSLIQDYSDAGRLSPAWILKSEARLRNAYWELLDH